MAFVKLPESILMDPKITDLQIRIIANLIKYSYSDNKSYIGYDKLAAACMITRRACINNIKNLEYIGVLRVNHRGNFSKSNEIELTLNNCSGVNVDSPLNKSQGVNVDSPLNESQGVNVDSPGGESRITPHIDNKFKYQDLNLKEKKEKMNGDSPLEEESATADVAAVRSMPCGEQVAAKSLAKEVCAADQEAKTQDFVMLQTVKDQFGDRFADIELFKVQNTYYVRQKGKFNNFAVANGAFATSGHFFNERIISA